MHRQSVSPQYFLLVLMVALWSIFWIPGIPTDFFMDFKDGLFLLFIGLSVVKLAFIDRLPLRLLFETPASRLLSIVLVFTFIGVITSPTPMTSFVIWARFVVAFLFYAILRHLFQASPSLLVTMPRRLIWSVLFSSLYSTFTLLGLIEPFAPPTKFAIRNPAAAGFSFRELALSYSIAFVMPFVFVPLAQKRTSTASKLLWGMAVILLLAVSFETQGRGGFLAAITGIGIIIIGSSGSRKIILLIVLVAIMAGIVLFGSLSLSDVLFNSVDLTSWRSDDLASRDWYILTSGRNVQWLLSIDAIQRSPIFGVGLGNFGTTVLAPEGFKGTDLHNFILGLAVEAGLGAAVAGAVFFLYVFVSYARSLRWLACKTDRFATALYAVLVACSIQTLFDIGAMFYSLYLGLPFWIALAALDTLNLQNKECLVPHTIARAKVAR
jgi:O-antigen ligase